MRGTTWCLIVGGLTNGDTTFFINPRLRDDDWMGPLLRDVPEVRAFVDHAAMDTTARRAP
jgi:hypothetical protein